MTKAELQAALDGSRAIGAAMEAENRQLRETLAIYERAFAIIENLTASSYPYWRGS